MTVRIEDDAEALRRAVASARVGLVDRELLVDVVALCAVAGEHLLVIGPPGTAKSEAVRRIAHQFGGQYFEYLLGRFTEPNEIFGSVDLQRLREGVVEIQTEGMLPEAEVAFLDEVFLGSTAILNTLLGILNERRFRRGRTATDCPLRVCVGASNSLPDDPALAAFADRFLARVFVDSVADARLEELLETAWSARPGVQPAPPILPVLDRLSVAANACDLSQAQPVLAVAVRRLRAAGVHLSDRRAVRSQRLVAAAAVLDGRQVATAGDLWVLPLITPSADAHALARDVLADLLVDARNATLLHAADVLTRSANARAARLAEAGSALLDELGSPPLEPDDRLRVEATLREIDTSFTAEDLELPLEAVRNRLIDAVRG